MHQFRIRGGAELSGTLRVSGAKNHALKMIPAAVLCDGPVELTNVPDISDIRVMFSIFEALGGSVQREKDRVVLDPSAITSSVIPHDLSKKVRTSILFVGPLLARFGTATFGRAGGDAIGKRPTDFFDEGFEALGVTRVTTSEAVIYTLAKRTERVRYVMPWVSHTVTEVLIMAGVRGAGQVRIVNAAMEPEVVALCEFLSACGAKIEGVGTPTIAIEGVPTLSGGSSRIVPDRIELATFAVLGALVGKDLTITDGEPRHLEVFWKLFERMGIPLEINDTDVRVPRVEKMKAVEFRTHEYPGLATDCQPPLTVLCTQAEGISLVHETIFEGRLFYTDLLSKMGANIILCDPHRAVVHGPSKLYGQALDTPDIRAGIALVLAAMRAEGTSVIENVHHIDRGYERIEERLRAVGVDIQREDCGV